MNALLLALAATAAEPPCVVVTICYKPVDEKPVTMPETPSPTPADCLGTERVIELLEKLLEKMEAQPEPEVPDTTGARSILADPRVSMEAGPQTTIDVPPDGDRSRRNFVSTRIRNHMCDSHGVCGRYEDTLRVLARTHARLH